MFFCILKMVQGLFYFIGNICWTWFLSLSIDYRTWLLLHFPSRKKMLVFLSGKKIVMNKVMNSQNKSGRTDLETSSKTLFILSINF